MSEMGSCAVCTFDENDEFGTVGRPLNDTNIKIVNPTIPVSNKYAIYVFSIS